MNELLSRLKSCTGRFTYRTGSTDLRHGSYKDHQIWFHDKRFDQTQELVIPTVTQDVGSYSAPLGWAQLLAFVLTNNGFTLAEGYKDGTDSALPNFFEKDRTYYGAGRIQYIPGQSITWWLLQDVYDLNSYTRARVTFQFPSSLDSIITASGQVLDPAALLMAILASLHVDLPKHYTAGSDYARTPMIRFRATGTGSAWTVNLYSGRLLAADSQGVSWTIIAINSLSNAAALCALANSVFTDLDSIPGHNNADFAALRSGSLTVPMVEMLDATSSTALVAGAQVSDGCILLTRSSSSRLLEASTYKGIFSTACFDAGLAPYSDSSSALDGIASGILALQETLATVQGGVSDANSGISGVSGQVRGVAADVESAKQAVLTAIGDIDVDLSPIQAQIEHVFSQASVDAQIVAAMAIKIAIGKLPKRLRATLLDALRNMRYDQGALPEYAGQYGGAINLYDMLFDSNGKPTFTQEAPDGSDTQH